MQTRPHVGVLPLRQQDTILAISGQRAILEMTVFCAALRMVSFPHSGPGATLDLSLFAPACGRDVGEPPGAVAVQLCKEGRPKALPSGVCPNRRQPLEYYRQLEKCTSSQ